MAHTVLAVPYVIITVSAALATSDADLEFAAMSLGASRFNAFRYVILPLIMPGLIAGGVFAFIVWFDEPVVSFLLLSVHDKTLPRKIFEDLEFNVPPVVAAVSTILTFGSIGLLGMVAVLSGWTVPGAQPARESVLQTRRATALLRRPLFMFEF